MTRTPQTLFIISGPFDCSFQFKYRLDHFRKGACKDDNRTVAYGI